MFDLTSIQDILKKEQSKIIIIEEGKPSYVLIPIEEYRALTGRRDTEDSSLDHEVISTVDGAQNDKEETSSTLLSGAPYLEERVTSRGIKLEDLPF